MAPQRIQLKRTKGWRMPPNTVKVDRTTPWGNPWRIANEREWGNGWVVLDPAWIAQPKRHYCDGPKAARELAVALHAAWARGAFGRRVLAVEDLVGLNLACWCGPGPCHADVLLELANARQDATGTTLTAASLTPGMSPNPPEPPGQGDGG